MRIPNQRLVIGIGLVALVGFIAAPVALAANNAGDVKVHNPGDNGEQRNDPHVGCAFYVEGFNMDASAGTITFRVWPPSGDKSVVHATGAAETWTADDTNEQGNHHFLSGPYSLPAIGNHPQGTHYKVFVSDTRHDKMKVFWVNCSASECTQDCQPGTCTENCTPTPCTVDCTPPPPCDNDCTPTTEVPFFPTAGSAIVAGVGALGTVGFALLRRK